MKCTILTIYSSVALITFTCCTLITTLHLQILFYLEIINPYSFLLPDSGNHHFTFCLYESDYSRYLKCNHTVFFLL